MMPKTYGVINGFVCSNVKRVAILHALRTSMDNSMQAEKIATHLGVSHRTAIYHLDILEQYGLVEVRKHKTKGSVLARSIWGLNLNNEEQIKTVFTKINNAFSKEELDEIIAKNVKPR